MFYIYTIVTRRTHPKSSEVLQERHQSTVVAYTCKRTIEPSEFDVIDGDEGAAAEHAGNQSFHQQVHTYRNRALQFQVPTAESKDTFELCK